MAATNNPEHKSGFVNILGNPNVGKSTLMNKLVGQKLSIITSKAQTTRHRIKGIVNGDDFQIVYSDTPGILNPKYKLQESMMKTVDGALQDADLILYVTDVIEKFDKHNTYIQKIRDIDVPKIIIINKIDLSNEKHLDELYTMWEEMFPLSPVVPVSALRNFNVDNLMNLILERIPTGPAWFPKDQLTDRFERYFVTEIIREKILLNYSKEIPYSVEVEIESYTEEKEINRIRALIHVARESQKGIIIGHQGRMLKKTGTDARREIEEFTGKKAFLEIYVKVNKEWRDNANSLKRFGY
ncbi:MAG: GTPase Era [Marinilabiliaceae bacterium]|nr:GTPase Era [Marinilabiliaceae bacterium]